MAERLTQVARYLLVGTKCINELYYLQSGIAVGTGVVAGPEAGAGVVVAALVTGSGRAAAGAATAAAVAAVAVTTLVPIYASRNGI